MKQIARQVRMTHWAQMMRERRDSGASVREWCSGKGINEKTYYYWQRRLREAACTELALQGAATGRSGQQTQSFTELRVAGLPAHSERISGAVQIEVGEITIKADNTYAPEQLATLLRALTQTC